MSKDWEIIIIDKEKRYIAEVSVWKTGAALSFKNERDALQDWLDEEVFDAIKGNYPEIDGNADYFEMSTGVKNVMMFADDGNLIADWGDEGYKKAEIKQPIVDFFTKFYNINKTALKKGVEKCIDEYDS